MNFKLTVIILVIIECLYRVVLNSVTYRSANNPTPENLKDVYDNEAYERWRRYCAENCRLDLITVLTTSVVSLIMLATNVYSAFASLFPSGMGAQLISVLLLETVVNTVVGFVFKYVRTMKIEEKYGFNRSTMKTFIKDRIKELVIDFALGYLICSVLQLLHVSIGDWLILLFAVVIFLVMLLIAFLYPVFSRIGNTFTPLEEGELKDRLMELLTKHGYQVKAIEVMDASRRTSKLNAYFTGFGKLKRIVLFDNLVNSMTPDEICAVFSHELGHGLNKDVLKGQIFSFLNLLVMSVVVWYAVSEPLLHTQFGFEGVNYGFAYILLSAALGVIQPFTSLLLNYRSRKAEYRADMQAVTEGYGEALITALKKLARENFAHLAPSKINVALGYSHPPLSARIAAIEKSIKK